MRKILFIIVCFSLAACAQIRPKGPYPENWRELVKVSIKQNFPDPYSIRDSEASAPVELAGFNVWQVCIRNNAKNRFGGYIGLRTLAIDIVNGVASAPSEYIYGCKERRFEPFPLD
ncbi:MAG: hypothetical protein JZU65_15835 [Chlorobium sp.]|nr:hypothetical protein [Chlorobium sp.]